MTNRHYCCVNGCYNNKRHKKYSFFFLPKDSERRDKWLKVIGRPDLLSKVDIKFNSYQVCSAHFDSSVMSEVLVRKLTQDAVPTKYLPNDDPQPYDDEEWRRSQAEARKAKMESTKMNQSDWNVTLKREMSTQTKCSFVQKFSTFGNKSLTAPKKKKPARVPKLLIKSSPVSEPEGKGMKRKYESSEVPEDNDPEENEEKVHDQDGQEGQGGQGGQSDQNTQEEEREQEIHEVQTVLIKVEPIDMADYE